jgi:hypothetical protein
MQSLATLPIALASLLAAPAVPPQEPAAEVAPDADADADIVRPGAALAVAELAPRDALGLALWDAREGRVAAALERVAALDAQGELGARIARAAARLAAWRDLRDAYLAGLAADGGKLVLMDGDERVRVTVEKVADGHLHLGTNKAGWSTYPVDTIPAGDLAQAMGKGADGLAPAWVRLYGYALAGNDKWERLLKDEDAESVALRADAKSDLSALLTRGRCLAELAALAIAADPADLAGADALLARIAALRADGAEISFVAERAAPLAALAGVAHGVRFDALGLEVALHGAVERLDGGRVRIEYSFEDEAELADLAPADAYLADHRKRLPRVPEEVTDEMVVRDGSLRCIGNGARRLALPFSAPLTVEYDVALEPPRSGELSMFHFFVGVCDDGEERFAWCSNLGDLEVWDGPGKVRQARVDERAIEINVTHAMRLEHDGERLRAFRNKEEVASIECGHASGSVFLWLQSGMRVNLRRIAVEGRVDEAGLRELRARWVAAQVGG